MTGTITTTNHKSETTNMNTNVNTIGAAILVQTAIRYGSFVAMLWIFLTFANDWVLAFAAG